MTSLTLPCIADKDYKDRLKLLAATRKTTMAALVREALDAHFSSALSNVGSYFAESVSLETQPENKGHRES